MRFFNATLARNNWSTVSLVHQEIALIESAIMNFSNAGYRQVKIDYTEVTSNELPSAKTISSIDTSTNIITVLDHEYENGITVIFTTTGTLPAPLAINTEYTIEVIDADNLKIYDKTTGNLIDITSIGTGTNSIRFVIESEKYYKSWMFFYQYPNAESYLNVMSQVEAHFRGLGYSIERYANDTTDTPYWHVRW